MKFLSVLLTLCFFSSLGYAAERPPNVVFIFVDDMGYGDIGPYGNKVIPTPNLDRMAKEGRKFTDFYVSQAVCSASRAALLTGCYSNRVGILGALGPNNRIGLHERETTIASMLKSRGYATAIFGKWHLGCEEPFLPTHRGFDEYLGLPYSNDMWPNHPTGKYPPLPLIEGTKTIQLMPDQTKLTTLYTERAIKFIEKNKEKPFFLYLPHSMPHVPLHVSEKFKGKSKAGLYGDVVMELDWSVGEIMNALKRDNLEENTILIFSSDNGPWLTYGNHGGSSGGLREGKGTSFEGGIREPFLIRWPGKIPANSICREPAMTIDILPTLAKWCGAELPKLKIDGKDISALCTSDAKSPQEAYYFYWGQELQAIRSGDWKLHFEHTYRTVEGEVPAEGKPAKQGSAKLLKSLYNLKQDPAESKDLLKEHPEIVERLEKLAQTMREDLGDTLTKTTGTGIRPARTLPKQ
ncbi:sulfatase [Telmatocola sphagniphila]|uniref:Sulfatase n=1 Tax=Telmatocola sphagniphila TaxID=1123043 RepID=A0A8E6B5H9_9BACT|nr:sulfatase [Telmatocola sphagniphila]QVL31844.1 sulfatase [Telmatocola sphagniphila]